MTDNTTTVTICGSMRRSFTDMLKVAGDETCAGKIVHLPVPVSPDTDPGLLDDLHRRKIDMSSEVIVVTRGGYIGQSTSGEIKYAEEHGKPVRYVEAAKVELGATRPDTVTEFCAERAQYITSINNCHPDNYHDYHRWQGHAEARRQLSQRLGLPVAWPEAEGA